MTYDDAVREASKIKSYYPYRIVGVVSKDKEVWEVSCGKTMHRLNNLSRKGYEVLLLESALYTILY